MRRWWLQVAFLLLVVRACEDQNCNNCDTYIASEAGDLFQSCFGCFSGFKLGSDGKCVKDQGLIIGISIAAAVAVAAEIACYIWCKIKNENINKKKPEITLADIHRQEAIEEGAAENKGEDGKEAGGKEKSEGKLEREKEKKESAEGAEEEEKESVRTEFKAYITHKCGTCRQELTSVKTSCGHYFHHHCFRDEMIVSNQVCPQCNKRGFDPVDMVCPKCLNRKRTIQIESVSNFNHFQQYTCYYCKEKLRKEEQAKKWYRRCC